MSCDFLKRPPSSVSETFWDCLWVLSFSRMVWDVLSCFDVFQIVRDIVGAIGDTCFDRVSA